jgi:hypothetical protein
MSRSQEIDIKQLSFVDCQSEKNVRNFMKLFDDQEEDNPILYRSSE